MVWRAVLIAVLAGGSAACTLVDQTTFNPDAGKRPVVAKPTGPAPPAPAEAGPPPLLSIPVPLPPNLRAEIGKAVAAARARKPDVAFDVVEITPDAGSEVGAQAAEVARLVIAAGVRPARVQLAVRPAPAAAREVRVFVH